MPRSNLISNQRTSGPVKAHLTPGPGIYFNPSHTAIKISINATAAGFICKNIFPTPVQVKNNY